MTDTFYSIFLKDLLLIITIGVITFLIDRIKIEMEKFHQNNSIIHHRVLFYLLIFVFVIFSVYILSTSNMSLPFLLSPLTAV